MVQQVVESDCDIKFANDCGASLGRWWHVEEGEILPFIENDGELPTSGNERREADEQQGIDDELKLKCKRSFPWSWSFWWILGALVIFFLWIFWWILVLSAELSRWIFWWTLEILPTYYEWQERLDPEAGDQWVWRWQFRQVTHPLCFILAIVLIEYHGGDLPSAGRSWNWGRRRVLPSRPVRHTSL